MSNRVTRMFRQHNIDISEIQYLYHTNQKTFMCMTDGREISTHIPLKEVARELPAEDFWNIQKGTVVSANYILKIDGCVYTMVDGRCFQGRKRNPAEHKRRRREFEIGGRADNRRIPLTLLEKCMLMEDSPIAFCIIELVFEQDGRGIDFIFRYCNKEMETVEGIPVSEMLDRSFYSIFPNGDRKWIVPYADVALNGSRRTIRDFSPEINKNLIIHCFQPQQGYCACFLVIDESGKDTDLG